jgi:hypothetical protein
MYLSKYFDSTKTIGGRLHVQFYVLYSTIKLRINVDHCGVAKPTNKCGSEGLAASYSDKNLKTM